MEKISAFLKRIGLDENTKIEHTVDFLKLIQYHAVTHLPYENIDIINGVSLKLDAESLFDKIVVTQLDNSRALKTQEILQNFYECGRKEIVVIDDVEQAFEFLCQKKDAEEQLYVAGSLYLVGKIKEIIGRNQND